MTLRVGDRVLIRDDNGEFTFCSGIIIYRNGRSSEVQYKSQGRYTTGKFGNYDLKKIKDKLS